MIRLACLKQLRRSDQAKRLCLIGAGVGRFLVKELAAELGLEYLDFTDLFRQVSPRDEIDAADCAPAVAVAYLAGGFG